MRGEVAGEGVSGKGELGEAQGPGAKGGAVGEGAHPRGGQQGPRARRQRPREWAPAPCAFPCKCATL